MKHKTKVNIDEKSIFWKECMSEKGKKYEVGYLIQEDLLEADKLMEEAGKKDFGITVNWPVEDITWKNTTSEIERRAAITRYALYKYDGFYKYQLYFTNKEHYNYYFYDETGDMYQVNTFRNGDHFVRFNSDEPRIVYVTGS
jgi:hypothetical protein